MTKPEYAETLDILAALLKRKPLTAREIATTLKCCRPAAYQRLAALRARGDKVREEQLEPDGTTGPRPMTYWIR